MFVEYEKMLQKAHELLPKEALTTERFELPRLESSLQGTKTIVKNFQQVVKTINREAKHLMKFFTNELGVPITFDESKLSINGKFSEAQLNQSFKSYANEYVLCHECKKPDTKIMEQASGVKVLKCDACGASKPVKRL